MSALEGLLHGTWIYEHAIIEITLVYAPHVHQTQHQNEEYSGCSLQLLIVVQHHQTSANGNKPERTYGVKAEHVAAHLRQIGKQGIDSTLIHTSLSQRQESIGFGGRDIVAKEYIGYQPEKEADATRDDKAEPKSIDFSLDERQVNLYAIWLLNKLLQRHESHQRHGKLCYNEDRCHGAELVVHGHIIKEEIGQTHEILTPR